MKKKQYIHPQSEVTKINVMVMKLTGEASVLPGVGKTALSIP